ncbi:hypothetical protein HNP86_001982 [Methanococcus maripaludis]|uniref:Uncharacterized protein n=1 Tax=Methanococcus maripaludis TaxID=39152 RepID=A0A7J9NXS4_METMI|nr:hypothetical protein [Methanococcus maripaludis]MBA2851823.1 hypothetical protein [Methanococcus maripaludis]
MNRFYREFEGKYINMKVKSTFPRIGGLEMHIIGYYDDVFDNNWRHDRFRTNIARRYALDKAVDRIPELSGTGILIDIANGYYDVEVADDDCVIVGYTKHGFVAVNYGDLRNLDGSVPDFCHFIRATDSDEFFDVDLVRKLNMCVTV